MKLPKWEYPKWDSNGIRCRDEEEMDQIMNDIQEYVDTNNKESLRRYNDIWDRISVEKGFDDDSVYDLIDRLDTDSKIFIFAAAADIWDVLHPLTKEEEIERSRTARKSIIERGILP